MHARHMQHAIRLAHAQLGRTAPNPAVGCVIVRDGHIVGSGATARGGRPHAETQALKMAGEKARGASVYVTLEPCSHTGETGPCAEALIDAGIAEMFIANRDPNPKVAGRGVAMLQEAGIQINEGIEAIAAAELHAGFFRTLFDHRPLVSLKIASSLDSKIASASGQSQWITGAKAREYGHLLRAQHDGILTGIGTALADDPSLTCRLVGRGDDSPKRYILDRNDRLPSDAKMHPCTAFNADLPATLRQIADDGITRLLVEAGPTLNTALIQAGLVDQIYWFRAPILIGESGRDAIGALADEPLESLSRMQLCERINLGEDVCELYKMDPCLQVL